ncbi:tetratricopeptide repeat domain protein [Coleofasciculus chthonoplastes PCC 7420]|uniref:Tetratricopeptide repeat domain protein n=1 Tax=Coleofasciculus chthonoplastes PCC 7420 TaxID=118168 RepID=B4VV24_9CYAN|nr:tetratricopeptide repeat protein [Coleofasciculus chthonoplastes]EDX74254.1 tetratricopeptide repeat domain protein [Coleofasciculus chthonoplastes PCC 7420]
MLVMLEFIHKLTPSFLVTLFLPLMALGNKFPFGLVQAQTIDFQNQTITGCGNPGNSNFDSNEVLKLCIEAINIELEFGSLWKNQKFEEARFKLKQALTIWQQLGNKKKEGHILNLLAASYFGFNQIEQALPLYQQALEIYQQVDDPEEKMKALRGLGSLSEGDRHYQQALDYYQEALAISHQVDDKCSEAVSLSSIGGVYLKIAHPYNKEQIPNIDNLTSGRSLNEIRRQALDYYYQALPLAHISSCHLLSILNSIGVVYQHLGQEQEALKFYQQALTESRRRETNDSQASILANIAVLKSKQGNLQEAFTDIQSAIDIVENYRTYLISPDFRTTYFSSQQNIYETYIDILMQLHQKDPTKGYDAQAFYASERSRARSLIELLAEANVDIRQGVDPQLLEQERNLQEELDGIEKRRIELSRGYYSQAQADQLEQTRQTVWSKYKNLQDEIRLKSPNYGALQYPQPLTLTQVQQQLLDKDTILLQYSLGEERSYLWAVTKDSITNYQLPPHEQILSKISARKSASC